MQGELLNRGLQQLFLRVFNEDTLRRSRGCRYFRSVFFIQGNG